MVELKILGIVDVSDADAAIGDVKSPKTFYSGEESKKTGTMPTVALAPGSNTYPAGYHAGNVGGLDAIDTDLIPANIKGGINIFGRIGDAVVYAYTLSSAVLWSNDVEKQGTDGTTYVLAKSIDIADLVVNQSMRTFFGIRSDLGGSITYGKVYRNSSPVGTERSTSGGPVYYSEDLTFNDGNDYQIWLKTSTAGDWREAWCMNQRVLGQSRSWFVTLLA